MYKCKIPRDHTKKSACSRGTLGCSKPVCRHLPDAPEVAIPEDPGNPTARCVCERPPTPGDRFDIDGGTVLANDAVHAPGRAHVAPRNTCAQDSSWSRSRSPSADVDEWIGSSLTWPGGRCRGSEHDMYPRGARENTTGDLLPCLWAGLAPRHERQQQSRGLAPLSTEPSFRSLAITIYVHWQITKPLGRNT